MSKTKKRREERSERTKPAESPSSLLSFWDQICGFSTTIHTRNRSQRFALPCTYSSCVEREEKGVKESRSEREKKKSETKIIEKGRGNENELVNTSSDELSNARVNRESR
jgi:hypothetical protein